MFLLAALISTIIAIPWLAITFVPLFLVVSIGLTFLGAIIVLSTNVQEIINNSIENKISTKSHILVVDDDFSSVLPLICLLEERNLEVKFVSSGQKMIRELNRNTYDLVFLDMQMPQMTGEIALRKSDLTVKHYKKLPVVFYSGKVTSFDTPKDLKHFEVRDFWRKRDLIDLHEKVTKLCSELPFNAA